MTDPGGDAQWLWSEGAPVRPAAHAVASCFVHGHVGAAGSGQCHRVDTVAVVVGGTGHPAERGGILVWDTSHPESPTRRSLGVIAVRAVVCAPTDPYRDVGRAIHVHHALAEGLNAAAGGIHRPAG